MNDDDQLNVQSSGSIIVATTVATLLLATAGSAYLYRSKRATPGLGALVVEPVQSSIPSSSTGERHDSNVTLKVFEDTLANGSDGDHNKNSRSKERRRRGKDSHKEILKLTKRGKGLTTIRTSRPSTADSEDDHGSSFRPGGIVRPGQSDFSTTSKRSRDTSIATSSRSPSSSTRNQLTYDDDDPSDSRGPDSRGSKGGQDSQSYSYASSIHTEPEHDAEPEGSSANPPGSPSASSSATSLSWSNTSIRTSTSSLPPNDLNPNTHTKPPLFNASSSPTVVASSTSTPGPWDWDGTTPTDTQPSPSASNPPGPYRKPPRFRSTSKSRSSPISPPTSTSTSTQTQPPSSSSTEHDQPLTFPTLNPSPPVHSLPPSASNNSNSTGHPTTNTTPRRAPTPSTSTNSASSTPPPQTLSQQTQIASLRGALEAARLREEKAKGDLDAVRKDLEAVRLREDKAKADMERYIKEVEMMRWDGRRREVLVRSSFHFIFFSGKIPLLVFFNVSFS